MWLAFLGFLKEKGGPYGVAIAVLGSMTYLAVKILGIPSVTPEAICVFAIIGVIEGALAITYFNSRNTREQSTPTTNIYLKFGDKEPILITEDNHMSVVLELTADQQVTYLGFDAFDRTGGPVAVSAPVLEVVTEGAFEIIDVDGVKKLRPAKQGLCQFKAGADPVPEQSGEPGEVFGYFEINVVPGKARTIVPKLGAIEDIPAE